MYLNLMLNICYLKLPLNYYTILKGIAIFVMLKEAFIDTYFYC